MERDASNGSNMVALCDNNSSIFEVHAILVILYGDCNQTEPIGINGSRCHTLMVRVLYLSLYIIWCSVQMSPVRISGGSMDDMPEIQASTISI